jgi:endonuclease VIII
MPEGHTIRRLARDLERDLAGHVIAATSPQGRFADGAAAIDGARCTGSDAAGKHLFVSFDDDQVLYIHLGLIGKFRRYRASTERGGTVRLRLVQPTWAWDLTGPQTCRLVSPLEADEIAAKLGPDPLRPDANPQRFFDRVQRSNKAIGALLLEQDVIAGIGNVYRAELLFLTGIHPSTPGKLLSTAQLEELWQLTIELLSLGVELNRIVTVIGADADGVPPAKLTNADRLYAYKRSGLGCRRCDTSIEMLSVAGRSIWFCPKCQPRTS